MSLGLRIQQIAEVFQRDFSLKHRINGRRCANCLYFIKSESFLRVGRSETNDTVSFRRAREDTDTDRIPPCRANGSRLPV
jgi:hypothetical protein